MNIFISWSGEKSRRIALALKAFLQDVNQRIIAWFSEEDITAGQRWGNELSAQLENTNFGIICVTQEALQSQWLIFEAGALSKSVKIGRVCPYIIDFDRRQLTGPLSQFQAKEANKEQTWQLLQSINLSMGDDALTEERLKRYFEAFWPPLHDTITTINNELKSLPNIYREKLMNILPMQFYKINHIIMLVRMAGISPWKVYWNQAAIYLWSDVIQTAVNENKLRDLLEVIFSQYGMYTAIDELKLEVSNWEL
jgi:hypothetical protein